MAGKEVYVYFKVPRRPQTVLRRLENSFLESVIEFKPSDARVDPWRSGAFGLESAYQIKGNVSLIDEEIVIQFVAKNAGIHMARIFANTREICHPIAFVVTQLGQVESYDSFMSAKKALTTEPEGARGADTGFHSAISSALTSGKTTLRATASHHCFSRTPEVVVFSGRPSEHSKRSDSQRSRPPSTGEQAPQQALSYAGDVFNRTGSCTFDQLYGAKLAGRPIPGVVAKPSASVTGAKLTQDVLRAMDREAKTKLSGNLGFIRAKRR